MHRARLVQERLDDPPGVLDAVLPGETRLVAFQRVIQQPLVGLLPGTEDPLETDIEFDRVADQALSRTEFLPQHHAHRRQTLQIITAAEANGHARLAEMNRQVADNLENIIAALEADGGERGKAAAGAS